MKQRKNYPPTAFVAACLALAFYVFLTSNISATVLVWPASPSPTPPYTNWATAAHTIQDAVDAARVRDTVSVVGGVYATGGRAVSGTMTNRVVIDKAITVESLWGPEVTVIQGYHVPGTTNGVGAIRCVYLANGAVLSGFTLKNGATQYSTPEAGSGGGVWCESRSAVVTNCALSNNSASRQGGGAYSGTLINCQLTGNSVPQPNVALGGGAYSATLNNCLLSGNSASGNYGGRGGGAYGCTLNNCILTGNSATGFQTGGQGGGACNSTLNGCTLAGNYAETGGAAYNSGLSGCSITSNSAQTGGGAYNGTLTNCTLTGNSAASAGGGAYTVSLRNCILYYNSTTTTTDPNYSGGTLINCCTTPLPSTGSGNITAEPQLANPSHLSASSPCRGTGSAAYASGTDIDGESWVNPPSVGCDEYWGSAATGAVAVSISASWTNVAIGFPVDLTGYISGRVVASAWDFGDGTSVSNRPYASHAWPAPGDYHVVLCAYNETYPGGVGATGVIHVATQSVCYVSAASTNPVPPYKTWETASQIIQTAVDAGLPGGLVLVSNGVYASGGRAVFGLMTNRVAVTKPMTVRSLNGSVATVIQGGGVRCVYLTNGAALDGFTLSSGVTRSTGDWYQEQSGGGLWCESTNVLVTNCRVASNRANYYGGGAYSGTLKSCLLTSNSTAYLGGGAYSGTLENCVLSTNSASTQGGGAYTGELNNCTLTGNWAHYGGGTAYATLINCVLYSNNANGYPTSYNGSLNHCWTAEPFFVDALNGNFRLQSNSPCINAGLNAYASGSTDLDGNPRLVSGTVDIGAYEYQGSGSVISYAWLQGYGLPTDGTADASDPDADRLNTWQEWRCLTDPTNAQSVLRLLSATNAGTNMIVTWQSAAGVSYVLERSTNLLAVPPFMPLAANLPGQAGRTSFSDTNAASSAGLFYRVGVP